jgi:predicted dehydrogenase
MGAAEDVCNARIEFPSGCVANVTASRLAFKTERKIRIIADDAYISIDFARKNGIMIKRTANEEQLSHLRAELAAGKDLSDLDYTDIVKIDPLVVDDADQLGLQLREFIDAVREGRQPMVDVTAGCAAVQLAEQIVKQARAHADRIGVPHIVGARVPVIAQG